VLPVSEPDEHPNPRKTTALVRMMQAIVLVPVLTLCFATLAIFLLAARNEPNQPRYAAFASFGTPN